MLTLFEELTLALYGNPGVALAASLLWGILSILISPCHLAAIPLVVAFINDQKEITTGKAFRISFMFSLGILITLVAVGLITSLTGLILGSTDMIMRIVISIVLLFVGLYFLGVVPLPDFGGVSNKRMSRNPYVSGLILGLFFGIALGPCAFAFMAPILGIVMQNIETGFLFSIALLVMFLIGHCGVLILAGTFTRLVKQFLAWDAAAKGTLIIRKICGILIIIGAVYTFVKAVHF